MAKDGPWWLEEEVWCRACSQGFAASTEVRCRVCDEAACIECMVAVRRRGSLLYVCADCNRHGLEE